MNDLDLPIRTLGRPASQLSAEIVRELTGADIALLASAPRGVTAPRLRRLSQSHHQLAQVLASGAKPGLAAVMTGYSASRISILQADPAFQDLIAFYEQNKEAAFQNFWDLASGLSVDMMLLVRDRLEEDPDQIGLAMAHDFIKLFADRTGNGPQSKSTNLHVNVNLAERVAAGRARVGRAQGQLSPPDPALPSGDGE